MTRKEGAEGEESLRDYDHIMHELNLQSHRPPRDDSPSSAEDNPSAHPLLNQILAQNLPLKARSVRQAWTVTLINSSAEANTTWLRALHQATIEASAVPELVITSRVS